MGTRAGRLWGLLGLLFAVSATVLAAGSGTADGSDPAGDGALPETTAPPPAPPLHPVRIYVPDGVGRAHTGELDALGRPVRMECVACHSKLEEAAVPPQAAEIDSVHTGMVFAHGNLTCYACHDPKSDYALLRLADGARLLYPEVMTLCSQCHGPQRKDFDHGAHGGMTGSWDLTRGPRDRNACIVCHDAHAPAFPRMQPTFKPIDRFLSPASAEESAHD